jgi:hypothetical protein
VIPKTILKSKNNAARGMNKMEEPKPETVPIISATSARAKKSARLSIPSKIQLKKGSDLLPFLE